jgi:hypothetical protein
MLIVRGGETDGQRATRLGGSLWTRMPNAVLRELERARRPHYGRGLALELLRDFERVNGLEPDRSERMIHAATVLLQAALPLAGGFNALTPQVTIQSIPCQLWVRCDLEPTMHQVLLNLNPAPTLVIRGTLTQRFGLRVQIDAIGTGALGSTTLKISFDNGATYAITGFVTTATMTQLLNTDIWLSCGVGPYDAADEWISVIGSLADQAGTGSDRDFINNNESTSFFYQANTAAIRNRASMSCVAANNQRFVTQYTAPDPGTTPSLVIWVGNASAFVNTGRIWGTGTVNQFCVRQATPSPTIAQAGAVAVNSTTAMVVGTWFGCEGYFADSTADRLRIGTTAVGPAAAGGCQSGVPNSGYTLGARAKTGALPSTYEFAEFDVFTSADATAAELARDRARRTLFYGVAA